MGWGEGLRGKSCNEIKPFGTVSASACRIHADHAWSVKKSQVRLGDNGFVPVCDGDVSFAGRYMCCLAGFHISGLEVYV